MVRLLIFFAVLLAAALGLALLLETPGAVQLTYGGFEYRVTLAKAVAIMIAVSLVMLILWSLLRTLLRLPSLISLSNRMRRRAKGYSAVSRGLVSVGVGDRRSSARYAAEAERLLGRDPMTLLLKAQSAQLAGDRKGAEAAFTRMLDNPETKVLGLRGLFIEAKRENNEGARSYAEEAYRIAPASPWAGQAVLEYRTADKDWRGAVAAIEESASRRVIDRDTSRRQKSALMAAEASEAVTQRPDYALGLATQALKLNPAQVQAALVAASRHSAKGDYSKATRLLETTWKQIQHPDVADSYLGIRHGDSTHDRLKRAKTLLRLTPKSRAAGLTVAQAAIEAREFDLARSTLEPLVLDQPTVRACRLMAELEDREHGNAGMVRKWLARASRAPRDPAWVADGFVSDVWAPVSPVSGRIDAFEWRTPPESITSNIRAAIDADHAAESAAASATAPARQDVVALPAKMPDPVVEPEPEAAPAKAVEPVKPAAEPPPTLSPVPSPSPLPAPAPVSAPAGNAALPALVDVAAPLPDEPKTLRLPPDDPGPRSLPAKSGRFFR